MSNKMNSTEKRKHKRLKAKEGTFAVVTSDYNKIGQIRNISKGGLSFQYIGEGEESKGSVEIEIFSAANSFYLRKLAAKVVVDFEVDHTVPFSSLPLRQLVVQFKEMQPTQTMMLDYFLQQYTTK
jgi:hypothetical protein